MNAFTSSRILTVLGVALTGLCCSVSSAQDLDAAAQKQIIAATFEVVQLKPPEGAVTYERPLPLDLIPYQERIDKYRSVGTAFAIGPNLYVTAGHVLVVGAGSQFGPPALRDAAGTVYEIDKILKYSDARDFAEFSLKRPPADAKFLPTAAPPPLNDPVFAVGNALGEGVVIRNGVYTSATPEETNGSWNWLRFTAAASPGNSGGPLVDKQGRVIGIVLRKSAAENLNYAGPISLVNAASSSEATVDGRTNFRLPVMDASETIETHERFALPATVADFNAHMIKVMDSIVVHSDAQLLEHNKDRLFPNGAGSDAMLERVYRSPLPRLLHEQPDHNWAIANPQVRAAQLENNGFVRFSGIQYRLRAPDNVRLATLYGDSKLYMDLMLRSGFSANRKVGTATDKVTSLGKAQEESTSTDIYGRIWQVKIWAVPFGDIYLVTMNLPTPEGYVAMFISARGSTKDAVLAQEKMLANFTYVTFEGTLARWREYLPLRSYQPKVFGNFSLDIDDSYRQVRFESKRFDLHVTPDVVPLSATTILALNLSFFKDGNAAVWDIGGILMGESAGKHEYVDVRRFVQPVPSLPDGFQNNWKELETAEFPYNGVAADDKGGMKASTTVAPAGIQAPKVRYALTVRDEGAPTQVAIRTQLDALQSGFKDLEH